MVVRLLSGQNLPRLRPLDAGLRQQRALDLQQADFAGLTFADLVLNAQLRGRTSDLAESIFDLAEDFALFADTNEKEFANKARKDLTTQEKQYKKTVANFVKFANEKLSTQTLEDNRDLLKAVEQSGKLYPAAIEEYVTAFRKFLKNPKRGAKAFLLQREATIGIKNILLTNLRDLGRLVAKSK